MVKKQTGIWVDGQVWQAYRELCSREKLRPGEPIEEFVKLLLHYGSALGMLNMIRQMGAQKIEGFEAYTQVLLNWFTHKRYFVPMGNERDLFIEVALLEALKQVSSPELRKSIEEALTIKKTKKDTTR